MGDRERLLAAALTAREACRRILYRRPVAWHVVTSSSLLHGPNDKSDNSLWTHRLGGLVAIKPLLEERGLDCGALLADVGLPPNALDSPDNRIPSAMVAKLVGKAAELSRSPHFGIEIGQRWPRSDAEGLMIQRVLCSSSLGEALESLTVFQRLNSNAAAAYLLKQASPVTLGFTIFQPGLRELAVVYDVAVSSQVAVIREGLQQIDWAPSEVLLPHAGPADDSAYRRYFGCRVRFNSESACLRFPAATLQRTLPGADRARATALEREAFVRLDKHLLPLLYRSLRLLLLEGGVRGEGMAQHLALHRRTLDRRLRALGTTFQSVLDEVRFDIAKQLLSETDLLILDIAMSAGFAESSSFVRAFKTWTGTSPQRWRVDQARTRGAIRS